MALNIKLISFFLSKKPKKLFYHHHHHHPVLYTKGFKGPSEFPRFFLFES